jgi:xanthine dehydrogenase YagS FAD-binding subunit
VHDALAHLASGYARVSAGGTDLAGTLQIEGSRVSKVVSIEGVDDLRGIAAHPDRSVQIGALTTLDDVAKSPILRGPYLALAQSADIAIDERHRARATIGGNICQRPRCWYLRSDSPCARKGGDVCLAADGESAYHAIFGGDLCHIVHPSDVAPALLALGAEARVLGQSRPRSVPFDDFFVPPTLSLQRENVLTPTDILGWIVLPPRHADSRSTFRRVTERPGGETLASVAVSVVAVDGVAEQTRIVLGAAAPVPWRAREAEAILEGFQMDRLLIAEAVEAAFADAVPLVDNQYKVGLFKALLVDALEDIWGLRPTA